MYKIAVPERPDSKQLQAHLLCELLPLLKPGHIPLQCLIAALQILQLCLLRLLFLHTSA